jgi:hypothetical protein
MGEAYSGPLRRALEIMPAMERVVGIARDLSTRWAEAQFDHERFPALAAEVLADGASSFQRPGSLVSSLDLAKWIIDPRRSMGSAGAGEPTAGFCVTLHAHQHFTLELQLARPNPAPAHAHPFAGAACVLAGSAIEMTYRFTTEERINERLALGTLTTDTPRFATPGTVRELPVPARLVHAVVPTSDLTLTLLAKARPSWRGPCFTYLSRVARDQSFRPEHVVRRLQALNMLHESKDASLHARFADAVSEPDIEIALVFVAQARRKLDDEAFARVVERARGSHGPRVDVFVASLEGSRRRQTAFESAAAAVSDDDERWLNAASLLAPSRAALEEMVEKRFGLDRLGGWLAGAGSPYVALLAER